MSNNNNDSYDVKIKLLIIGDQSIGKTCLLERFVNNTFSISTLSTIGIDFRVKYLEIDSLKIKLQVWDTGGQERFRTITRSYFRGSHGVLLAFDCTSRKSFESIDLWLKEIAKNADDNINKMIVGTKIDDKDKRVVFYDEALALANKYNLPYIETSALDGSNVEECFMSITTNIKTRLVIEGLKTSQDNHKGFSLLKRKIKVKGCC
jgi:small GTP-binding protein